MGKVFRKAVLKVDRYHSGDGVIDVTPERLQHWQNQFQKLSQRYVVPMHFNHADFDDPELLMPVRMSDYEERKSRGAQASEGRLLDFKVAQDGGSAELTVEVRTPSAIEKVEHNTVFVSPVIFPELHDGAGDVYHDVITSVDLVDYPVDHSQGPFIPANEPALMGCGIRMGLSKSNHKQTRVLRMDMVSGQDAGNDTMAPPAPGAGGDANSVVSMIVNVLQEVGIQLPEDTNASNIVDRIRQTMGNGGQGGAPGTNPVVAAPEIQTMSMQVRSARAYAEGAYHRDLLSRLEKLRDTGRIMDEEFSKYQARIGAQRLSLDSYNKPKEQDVERFMASRQVIPEGTFKTSTFVAGAQSRIARLSVAQPPAPKEFGRPGEGETAPVPRERIEEIKQMVNG